MALPGRTDLYRYAASLLLGICSSELSWPCSTMFAAMVASNLDRAIANAVNPRRLFSMLARGDLAFVWVFAAVAIR